MIISTENIDGIVKEFTTAKDFMNYTMVIFDENESFNEVKLLTPKTPGDCLRYILEYAELHLELKD